MMPRDVPRQLVLSSGYPLRSSSHLTSSSPLLTFNCIDSYECVNYYTDFLQPSLREMHQAQRQQEGWHHRRTAHPPSSPLLRVFHLFLSSYSLFILSPSVLPPHILNLLHSLLENVRVRRAGFANRQTYERFYTRFGSIHASTIK